ARNAARALEWIVAAAGRVSEVAFPASAATGAGHCRVSYRERECHAQRAIAQPQALQGPARAERFPDGRVPRYAVGAGGAASRERAPDRRLLARHGALRI